MPYLRLSQRIAGLVSTQHHTTSPCFAIKRKVKTRLGSCGVGPDPVIESQYVFWTSPPALPRLSHRTSGSFSGEELQFAHKPFFSLFSQCFSVLWSSRQGCGAVWGGQPEAVNKPAFLTPAAVPQALWADPDWRTGSCPPARCFWKGLGRARAAWRKDLSFQQLRERRGGRHRGPCARTGLCVSAHGDWGVAKITSVRP